MENKQTEYKTGAAALFSMIARDTVMNLYCDTCGTKQAMPLVRSDDREEVYRCPACGNEKWFAVR